MNIFHLLTPRDWASVALHEANSLIGTAEYQTKMVEYRRFMLMADYMDYVKDQVKEIVQ